jgi:acyl carrier protein
MILYIKGKVRKAQTGLLIKRKAEASPVLDSLLTMQLIEKLEEEFDIRISNDDFTHFNFNSLDALEKLISVSSQ